MELKKVTNLNLGVTNLNLCVWEHGQISLSHVSCAMKRIRIFYMTNQIWIIYSGMCDGCQVAG